MSRVREVVLKEYVSEKGGFRQWWYTAVPPEGSTFRVTEDKWEFTIASPPVRHILDWELDAGHGGTEG